MPSTLARELGALVLAATVGVASGTVSGCTCLVTWDYRGEWFHGCDPRRPHSTKPWCVVDMSTCERTPEIMSTAHTRVRIEGQSKNIPLSQAALEHGDRYDYCSLAHDALTGSTALQAVVEDPFHPCPARTWSNVAFVQRPDGGGADAGAARGRCAQLCLNPSYDLRADGADLLYGTTCAMHGYTVYASTATLSDRHVVHWYTEPSADADGPRPPSARSASRSRQEEAEEQQAAKEEERHGSGREHGEEHSGGRRGGHGHHSRKASEPTEQPAPSPSPALSAPPSHPPYDTEHPCDAKRMHEAVHFSDAPPGARPTSCQQICLNPAFEKPAGKRGVLFGRTCLGEGYTRFVREEKTMGQVIFVYALPTNGTATDSAGGAAPGGGSAAPASADSEQAAEPAAHSRGGRHSRHGSSHARGAESAAPDESEEEEEVDLSSLGRCPLVGDPDMKAAEAMGVLCAVGEDTDCSALPGFLALLASSQPTSSKEAEMFALSAHAISYICDACTAALRPYITSGATADPPPSEVRAAVCAEPACGRKFQDFVSTLHAGASDDVEELCALDERRGNRAMGALLARLAGAIEGYMGLSQADGHAAASALLRAELGTRAPALGAGRGRLARGALPTSTVARASAAVALVAAAVAVVAAVLSRARAHGHAAPPALSLA